jgi:hypothetical protein
MGETRFDPNTIFPHDQKVNERSKKALVHRIKSVPRYVNVASPILLTPD